MSRNNVFKLSGNMALGSQDNYPSNDFENIKSSLKLLKSKQPQKRSEAPLEPTVTPPSLRISTAAHTPPTLTNDKHPNPKVTTVTFRKCRTRLQLQLPTPQAATELQRCLRTALSLQPAPQKKDNPGVRTTYPQR